MSVALFYPNLIKTNRFVKIEIAKEIYPAKAGFKATSAEDKKSKIRLIDEIDLSVFEKALIDAYKNLPIAVTSNKGST